jgi:hypothetical protein
LKLEYLAAGSKDCPLIRLFEFNASEARRLSKILRDLSNGLLLECALHSEAWVEVISGCRLTLRAGSRDLGIRQTAPADFVCEFTADGEAWLEMSEKVDVIISEDDCITGYQWLDDRGKIGLLLSRPGSW